MQWPSASEHFTLNCREAATALKIVGAKVSSDGRKSGSELELAAEIQPAAYR